MRRFGPPPEPLYFKIGEAARIVGVETHVLRYWEKAFDPLLKPPKTEGGHRRYRRQDVQVAMQIRRLLHEEKMTIDGARRRLLARRLQPGQRQEAASARREALLRTDLAVLRRELAWLLERVEEAHRIPVVPRVVADERGLHLELQVVEPIGRSPGRSRATHATRDSE